jgi:hypothetical protein
VVASNFKRLAISSTDCSPANVRELSLPCYRFFVGNATVLGDINIAPVATGSKVRVGVSVQGKVKGENTEIDLRELPPMIRSVIDRIAAGQR